MIKLVFCSGWSNCDDCGSYDWATLELLKDGEMIWKMSGDGHLSNPPPDQQTVEAVHGALQALGHDVVVVYEDVGCDNP